MMLDEIVNSEAKDEKFAVFRLKTSHWKSGYSINIKRTLTLLKRKSPVYGHGFIPLIEDADEVDVEHAMNMITNLDECEDGLYIVAYCDERHDWETGIIDDWSYELIPYEED